MTEHNSKEVVSINLENKKFWMFSRNTFRGLTSNWVNVGDFTVAGGNIKLAGTWTVPLDRENKDQFEA